MFSSSFINKIVYHDFMKRDCVAPLRKNIPELFLQFFPKKIEQIIQEIDYLPLADSLLRAKS